MGRSYGTTLLDAKYSASGCAARRIFVPSAQPAWRVVVQGHRFQCLADVIGQGGVHVLVSLVGRRFVGSGVWRAVWAGLSVI